MNRKSAAGLPFWDICEFENQERALLRTTAWN